MRPDLRLIPTGLALIAVSYGLARFAYGLFLPAIRDDVGLSPAFAGLVGGGAYAGYCVAIIASAVLVERLGARFVAVFAGLVATSGMMLIALSTTPMQLAFAVLLAGMSTGLASPPMADAVSRIVPRKLQPRANTLINSGTSVGVVLSGPIALAATGQWREAYFIFTAIAAIVTLALALAVPGRATASQADKSARSRTQAKTSLLRIDALPVLLAATGMGFASAAYWTFAGGVIVELGDLPQRMAGVAWVVIGAAGLIGGAAGDLIRRFEINAVHRGSLIALASASLMLPVAAGHVTGVLTSAFLFGAAYIMLTGVYLVWGVRVYADRPAIGLMLPFLMIAVGQVMGAPAAGALIDTASYPVTFMAFAGVAATTMLAAHNASEDRTTAEPTRAACGCET